MCQTYTPTFVDRLSAIGDYHIMPSGILSKRSNQMSQINSGYLGAPTYAFPLVISFFLTLFVTFGKHGRLRSRAIVLRQSELELSLHIIVIISEIIEAIPSDTLPPIGLRR